MSAVLAFFAFLLVAIGTGVPDLLRAQYVLELRKYRSRVTATNKAAQNLVYDSGTTRYYLTSRPTRIELDIKLGAFTKVMRHRDPRAITPSNCIQFEI